MRMRWTRNMCPRRKSRSLGKPTSRVRPPPSVLYLSLSDITFPSVKGAVCANRLCPYLQPFPRTHTCKHHSHSSLASRKLHLGTSPLVRACEESSRGRDEH